MGFSSEWNASTVGKDEEREVTSARRHRDPIIILHKLEFLAASDVDPNRVLGRPVEEHR